MKGAEILYGELAHHVEQIANLSASDRVLWFLHWLVARERPLEGDVVRLPMSRRDTADYLGLTQEILSRVIRMLLVSGAVEARGPRTIVQRRPIAPREVSSSQLRHDALQGRATQPSCPTMPSA